MAKKGDLAVLVEVFSYLENLHSIGKLTVLKETEQSFLEKYKANELGLLNLIYDIVSNGVLDINERESIYLDTLFAMERGIILYGGDFTKDTIINLEDIDYIKRSLLGLNDFYDEVYDKVKEGNVSSKMIENDILIHWGKQINQYLYTLLDHKYKNIDEKMEVFRNFFNNINKFFERGSNIFDNLFNENIKQVIVRNIYINQEWELINLFKEMVQYSNNSHYYKIDEIQNDLLKDYELNEDKNFFKLDIKFNYLKNMGFSEDSQRFVRNGIYRAYKSLCDIEAKNILSGRGIHEYNEEINIEIKFYPDVNSNVKKSILNYLNNLIKNVYRVEVFNLPKENIENINQEIRRALLDEKIDELNISESEKRIKKKI